MKNFLLFVLFIFYVIHSNAQAPTWSEVKIHTGVQGTGQLARLGLAVEDVFHVQRLDPS